MAWQSVCFPCHCEEMRKHRRGNPLKTLSFLNVRSASCPIGEIPILLCNGFSRCFAPQNAACVVTLYIVGSRRAVTSNHAQRSVLLRRGGVSPPAVHAQCNVLHRRAGACSRRNYAQGDVSIAGNDVLVVPLRAVEDASPYNAQRIPLNFMLLQIQLFKGTYSLDCRKNS